MAVNSYVAEKRGISLALSNILVRSILFRQSIETFLTIFSMKLSDSIICYSILLYNRVS